MNSSVFPGLCNRKDQGFLFSGEESLAKVGDFEHWVSHFLLEGGSSFSGIDQRLRCRLNENIVRMN